MKKSNMMKENKMDRRTFIKSVPAAAVLASVNSNFAAETTSSVAKELQPIVLVKPETEGCKSVLAALKDRMTNRDVSDKELPAQMLSNLLWAAFGINREGGVVRGKPGRTAASASNSQEIDLYVAMPEGVYLYEAVPHRLTPVVAGDFRARAGRRGAASAPVNIFYVVDLTRYDTGPGQPDRSIGNPEVQKSYYYTDTGFIAQNVYLLAASQGLAAWFHNCDKENTVKEFGLRPEQRVLFAQSVGYPAER